MKVQVAVFGFFCCLSLCTCCVAPYLKKLFLGSHAKYNLNEAYLEAWQLIRQRGYPSEAHTIKTEDGYLITMHRIPHGIRGNKVATKGPVYLQHGFFGQSIDWLLLQPENDLAFLLADEGYDVWLGNLRGNTHSRAHISLTPCQKEFWDYTWHESGVYDLPAMIDYILETTNSEKLEYIGHSMGTTTFLVLMSMRPEYNQKIAKAHLLAPVAFLINVRGPFVKIFTHINKHHNLISKLLNSGALLPDTDAFKLLREIACESNAWKRELCVKGLFLIMGADPDQFDRDIFGTLVFHYPSGYSSKALNHYFQVYLSGEFKQYDYGRDKNMEVYGSEKPPSYILEKVTAPIVLYSGANDYLSSLDDAKKIGSHLSSAEDIFLVDFPKFNHLDFLFAHDAKALLYDEILRRMSKQDNRV